MQLSSFESHVPFQCPLGLRAKINGCQVGRIKAQEGPGWLAFLGWLLPRPFSEELTSMLVAIPRLLCSEHRFKLFKVPSIHPVAL